MQVLVLRDQYLGISTLGLGEVVQVQRASQEILMQVVGGGHTLRNYCRCSSSDLQPGCTLESPGELLKQLILNLCPTPMEKPLEVGSRQQDF